MIPANEYFNCWRNSQFKKIKILLAWCPNDHVQMVAFSPSKKKILITKINIITLVYLQKLSVCLYCHPKLRVVRILLL